MTGTNPTDVAIKLIRITRNAERAHFIAAGVVLMLVLGSAALVPVLLSGDDGGGGSAAPVEDALNDTNVTVTQDAENGTVTFTLAALSETADGVRLVFGNESVSLTEEEPTHTTDIERQAEIRVEVGEDDFLLQNYEYEGEAPGESNQTVEGVTPAISIQPETMAAGQEVTFDASESTLPEDTDNVTYEWAVDGEHVGSSETANFAFGTEGEHTVSLTISLDRGVASTTEEVFVGNEAPVARLDGDTVGTTDDTLSFDASASADPEGDSLTYEWEFGDNETATGVTAKHQYDNVDDYNLKLTVTDEWGASDTTTTTVSINNRVPNAEASIPNNGVVGSSLTFDATASSDPDGDNVSFEWDFGDGGTANSAQTEYAYNSPGTYTVRVYVTDEHGGRDVYRSHINIGGSGGSGGGGGGNLAPDASVSGPTNGEAGETIAFDARGSSDDDGDTLEFAWDFDDGTTDSGGNPTHTFESAGTYDVQLTTYDGNGGSDSTIHQVTIENPAPTASAAANPQTTNTDTAVSFDATGSSDPHDQSLTYEWEFGDGSTASGDSPTHSYDSIGEYTATVTVTDAGGESSTDTVNVTVENRAPNADASVDPQTGSVDDTYTFDASGTTDPEGHNVSYEWEFEDGTTALGATTDRQYNETGIYTATLTATDSEGDWSTDTVTVTVDNRGPTANITANNTTVTYGETIEFDGSKSTDPDGQSLTYEWDFDGDGNVDATGDAVQTHTYESSGQHNATLTVTDSDGATDTAVLPIEVQNEAPSATFTMSPTSPETAEQIEFNAMNSSDPEGHPLSFEWDMGDGTTGSEAVFFQQYDEADEYTVTLTVSDGDKADTATKTFEVSPRTIINDSFEDGNFDEWMLEEGDWVIDSPANVRDGSNVALSNRSSPDTMLSNDGDIPHDADISFQGYIEGSDGGNIGVNFARNSDVEYYRVSYNVSNSEDGFRLQRLADESSDADLVEVLDSEAPQFGTNEWIEFDINRTPDGEMTVTAHAPVSGETQTLTATDDMYTSPGQIALFEAGSADNARIDNVTVIDD